MMERHALVPESSYLDQKALRNASVETSMVTKTDTCAPNAVNHADRPPSGSFFESLGVFMV